MNEVGRTEGLAVLCALWGEEGVLGSCCMKSSDGETELETAEDCAAVSTAFLLVVLMCDIGNCVVSVSK